MRQTSSKTRTAVVQRITSYGNMPVRDERDQAIRESLIEGFRGPLSVWVAVTEYGQKVIAQGEQRDDVLRQVEEQGYTVGRVLNDWN